MLKAEVVITNALKQIPPADIVNRIYRILYWRSGAWRWSGLAKLTRSLDLAVAKFALLSHVLNATAWLLLISHVRVVIAIALKRKKPIPSEKEWGLSLLGAWRWNTRRRAPPLVHIAVAILALLSSRS